MSVTSSREHLRAVFRSFNQIAFQLEGRIRAGERGDSLEGLFQGMQELLLQVSPAVRMICSNRLVTLNTMAGRVTQQVAQVATVHFPSPHPSVGAPVLTGAASAAVPIHEPTREERRAELERTIDSLFDEEESFDNDFRSFYQLLQEAHPDDVHCLNQFFSQMSTTRDFACDREFIRYSVGRLVRHFVESGLFFEKAKGILRQLRFLPGNVAAFNMHVLQKAYDEWVRMTRENIDARELAPLLIGYDRMRRVCAYWQAHQGKRSEWLPLLLRLKEPLNLPLMVRSLFPLSEERERALARGAEACRTEVFSRTSNCADLIPFLMSVAAWYPVVDRECVSELADQDGPEGWQFVREWKTGELLAQLGFISEPLTPFDVELLAWVREGIWGENRVGAARRIREARADGHARLDLNELGLRSLPSVVGQLPQLKILNLENNRLETLPSDIAHLSELGLVMLMNNATFSSLPQSITSDPRFFDLQISRTILFLIDRIDTLSEASQYFIAYMNVKNSIRAIFQGNLPGEVDWVALQRNLQARDHVGLSRLVLFCSSVTGMESYLNPATQADVRAQFGCLLQGCGESELFLRKLLTFSALRQGSSSAQTTAIFTRLLNIYSLFFSQTNTRNFAELLVRHYQSAMGDLMRHPVQDQRPTTGMFIPYFMCFSDYGISWVNAMENAHRAELESLALEEHCRWIQNKTRQLLVEMGYEDDLEDPIVASLVSWSLEPGYAGAFRYRVVYSILDARMRHAEELDLSDSVLTSLPAAIGTLSDLCSLNLSRNMFETFPAEMMQLQQLMRLDLSGNQIGQNGEPPRLPESRELLDFLSMRSDDLSFEFRFDGNLPPAVQSGRNLVHAIRSLFGDSLPAELDTASLARALRTCTGDELQVLHHFFRNLRDMEDYRNAATHARTLERLTRVLQGFASHPAFLEATLIDLLSREVACDDETAFTFSQIEILRLLHCVAPNAGVDDLARILIGLKRLELLETWVVVRSIVGSNFLPDGRGLLDGAGEYRRGASPEVLEGSMVLRLRLCEWLWLPEETQGLRFSPYAEPVIGDFHTAARDCGNEVRDRTIDVEALLPLLMGHEMWRTTIARESEAEWLALLEEAPMARLSEFLLHAIDPNMSDEDKVACLAGTDIHIRDDAGSLKPIFAIQQVVQEEMTRRQYRLYLAKSCEVLLRLGMNGANNEAIARVRQELEENDHQERVRRQN